MLDQQKITLEFCQDYIRHKYNRIHFSFFLQMANMAGVEVQLVPDDDGVFVPDDALCWSCRINGQQVIFDYSDHYYRDWCSRWPDVPYFKFQKTHRSHESARALGPPMVGGKRRGVEISTLQSYHHIRQTFSYQPGTLITCKQLPNGAAVERRRLVHDLLSQRFSDIDIEADSDQESFWIIHEKCRVAVCVPGANNNMVDRGHMELLGLGVCTVSPRLDTLFPGESQLVPDSHYVRCSDDYSDLSEILDSLLQDSERCLRIARNARYFFDMTYVPQKYWAWIMYNLGGGHDQ